MYNASPAFHSAVRDGAPQLAMLIFPDAVFTNNDIDVNVGIEFDDNFCTEQDIVIGQAPSNEIRFALFNDKRLLNSYAFGEFTALLGVKVSEDTQPMMGTVTVISGTRRYTGYDTPPYLVRGGTPVEVQPSFPVRSILAYDGKVWVFSDSGQYAVYNDSNGANITAQNPVNSFMRDKSQSWVGKGMYYNKKERKLAIYESGKREWYEFVPLGVFDGERPNVPDRIRIEMDCLDRMQKFERDMPSASELGISFPVKLGTLVTRMCSFLNVGCKVGNFINYDATVDSDEPFKNATMRNVLAWIAEAAGSIARFDRDGNLIMDWIRTTGQSYSETDYRDFSRYWYRTPTVNKLYNRKVSDEEDATYGTGNVGYLIQDNPLM